MNEEFRKINKGDFVVVLYEGERFPGMILELEENSNFKIKTMTMSGQNWRWPEKEDVLSYEDKDVIKKIKPPILLNSRGIYAISDIN